jgi:hypothetical protein
VVHVGRLLRDPPRILRPDLGPRHALLAAAGRSTRGSAPSCTGCTTTAWSTTPSSSAPPTTASLSPAPRRPSSTAASAC